MMKKLLFSILLSTLVLSSCEIDEGKNLLFNLKDNLEIAGTWQAVGSLGRVTFNVDGTFTYRNSAGVSSSGTYTYSQVTSSSIWDTNRYIGVFSLRYNDNNVGTLNVLKASNDDLYFQDDGLTYVQIG